MLNLGLCQAVAVLCQEGQAAIPGVYKMYKTKLCGMLLHADDPLLQCKTKGFPSGIGAFLSSTGADPWYCSNYLQNKTQPCPGAVEGASAAGMINSSSSSPLWKRWLGKSKQGFTAIPFVLFYWQRGRRLQMGCGIVMVSLSLEHFLVTDAHLHVTRVCVRQTLLRCVRLLRHLLTRRLLMARGAGGFISEERRDKTCEKANMGALQGECAESQKQEWALFLVRAHLCCRGDSADCTQGLALRVLLLCCHVVARCAPSEWWILLQPPTEFLQCTEKEGWHAVRLCSCRW